MARRALAFLLAFQLGSMGWTQGLSSVKEDNAMREMILSASYGVLAGTLVGAASLAFTDQPGENLQRVARGASIGLYLGILLGLYVIYVVPKQIEKEKEDLEVRELPLNLYPILSDSGVSGLGAEITVLRF